MSSDFRPSIRLKHRRPQGGNRCDFCGSPAVSKLLPCDNFTWNAEPIFTTARGYWAVGSECAALVESAEWTRLVTRVMAEVKKRKELLALPPQTLKAEMAQLQKDLLRLYKLFAANCPTGSAIIILERRRGA